ncbi:MAG: hypothetical protein ABIG67_09410, partial [Pseudomonadota bacterium]
MDKQKRPKIEKNLLLAVSFTALFFLAAGAALGLWSTREMKEVVVDQFNEQQLVIARHVSTLIERQLHLLKKELLFLKRQDVHGAFDPETYSTVIQQAFYRVLESGLWKIEIIDLKTLKNYTYMPYKQWSLKDATQDRLDILPSLETLDAQEVWISPTQIRPFGISLLLGTSLPGDSPRVLLFDLNLSWFLPPFLSGIRSGKTGYAWIIDEKGNFLYHPNAEFIGRSAFEIREEKYPGIPVGIINFIQKEKMLQGRAGTGWFFSGWHRGITGKIKKLI